MEDNLNTNNERNAVDMDNMNADGQEREVRE
jgi:hypothetical protein